MQEKNTYKIGRQVAAQDIINAARDINVHQPITIQNLTIVIRLSSPEEFKEPEVQSIVKSSLKKTVPELTRPITKDLEIKIDADQIDLLNAVEEKEKQEAIKDSEILLTLGNKALYRGETRKAIEYHEKALKIAQEIGVITIIVPQRKLYKLLLLLSTCSGVYPLIFRTTPI